MYPCGRSCRYNVTVSLLALTANNLYFWRMWNKLSTHSEITERSRPSRDLAFFFWLMACMTTLALGIPSAWAGTDRPTVVELFTSQGCGSCLAAEVYLQKLAERDDILALTFPITYWDYLGWKDTFATPENDARQRAYAQAAATSEIYTPQIIIDGEHREIGSDVRIIEEIIAYHVDVRPPTVAIDLDPEPRTIAVNIAAGSLPKGALSATIWLIQYDAVQQVTIDQGENAGKRMRYVNVVRQMSPMGVWHGESKGLLLPLRDLRRSGHSSIAVVLQVNDAGPILGAASRDIGRQVKWP